MNASRIQWEKVSPHQQWVIAVDHSIATSTTQQALATGHPRSRICACSPDTMEVLQVVQTRLRFIQITKMELCSLPGPSTQHTPATNRTMRSLLQERANTDRRQSGRPWAQFSDSFLQVCLVCRIHMIPLTFFELSSQR